jgi:hypothetical protein
LRYVTSAIRRVRRAISLSLDPLRHKQEMLRRSKSASLVDKIAFDLFARPHYAYGVYMAAQQAKALGLPRITLIEFGVAGGNGLLALEATAREVGQALNLQIDTYGFDLGQGLPPPMDYRDLPYAWQAGQFRMDRAALEARLTSAKLIIGDVAETLPSFRAQPGLAPVGFAAFDLDYYSSTVNALGLFEGSTDHLLPRVFCYFDDCIGPDHELHCEYVGALLAIAEFNTRYNDRKLARIHGLRHKRILSAAWNDLIYVMHAFQHPLYGHYIAPSRDTRLDLSLVGPGQRPHASRST